MYIVKKDTYYNVHEVYKEYSEITMIDFQEEDCVVFETYDLTEGDSEYKNFLEESDKIECTAVVMYSYFHDEEYMFMLQVVITPNYFRCYHEDELDGNAPSAGFNNSRYAFELSFAFKHHLTNLFEPVTIIERDPAWWYRDVCNYYVPLKVNNNFVTTITEMKKRLLSKESSSTQYRILWKFELIEKKINKKIYLNYK